MNADLMMELADQKLAQLHRESEAARLARSVRRERARTLAHNRRVLKRVRGVAAAAK